MRRAEAPVEELKVRSYKIPTDRAESDGTLEWDSTTLVLVEVLAGGKRGMGYTYCDAAAAQLISGKLAGCVAGHDALAISECWEVMLRAVRNLGSRGIAAMAISAVDNALWDLKARLLEIPVAALLGRVRDRVPGYGSGGFTSYSIPELQRQLAGWADEGFRMLKMKIGRDPGQDVERVRAARRAIGAEPQLFVDANGAYSRKLALLQGELMRPLGVAWFEEPVSSDDLEGLALLRDRLPAQIEVSAGEYGYHPSYFRRMLEAGAVDVLQADVTRALGVTGFMRTAALCEAFQLPLSSHCVPALSVHVCSAAPRLRHLEWFHDHVRIEQLLFDGAPQPKDGCLAPDLTRPGFGLELKEKDAARYEI
ncbi:MAG TPA: enolase C-terminal domain-like protein [Steroidobacteraceae bacterium]|nr:enolase C-terminal domain-like protein [Steroidobacteraceae bacterium]